MNKKKEYRINIDLHLSCIAQSKNIIDNLYMEVFNEVIKFFVSH